MDILGVSHGGYATSFFHSGCKICKQNAVGMSTTSTSSSTSSTRQCLISFPSQDWWAGGFNLEQKRAGELVLNPQPWFKRILKAIAFSLNACMNIWFYGKPMFKSFSVTPKKHIYIYILYIYVYHWRNFTFPSFWGVTRSICKPLLRWGAFALAVGCNWANRGVRKWATPILHHFTMASSRFISRCFP